MSTDPDRTDEATRDADDRDAQAAHEPDRMPTPEEEEMAEAVAADVSPESAEHYREMAETGAEVRGEGEIGG